MDRQRHDDVTATASQLGREYRERIEGMSCEQLGAEQHRLCDLKAKTKIDVALRPSDRDAKWLLDAAVRWHRYVATVRSRKLGEEIEAVMRHGAATGQFDSSDPNFEAILHSARDLRGRSYKRTLRRDFRRVRLEVRSLRRTLNTSMLSPRRTTDRRPHRSPATSRRHRAPSRAGPSSPAGGDEPPPELEALDDEDAE